MIYGSIREPIWVARGEQSNVTNVKIIISDGNLFLGLCRGDLCAFCGSKCLFNLQFGVLMQAQLAPLRSDLDAALVCNKTSRRGTRSTHAPGLNNYVF